MLPLKRSIFDEVRKSFEESSTLTDDQLNHLLFHHPEGLRLSMKGFLVVKAIFTAYSFELPENIKTKHHFGMSRMEYPYFFTKRRLILFSEMDSMVIKLYGGVEGFLENCSQIGK